MQCPRCGHNPPTEAPEALCPACVLARTVLGPQPNTESPGAADAPDDHGAARFEPGDQFGPYRVERLLGRGGMGEVYEVEDVQQKRRVALKVLHQRLRRPEDRARFLAEGQLAAAVNHPNTVYVFGSKEIAGIPVIAMELLPGNTLKDHVVAHGPMAPNQAIDSILQVIEGLEAAHVAGILHRDVKPSNCFVTTGGRTKIGDFGLSISTTGRGPSVSNASSEFAGTPGYASPEQVMNAPLDVRSDIYSVGATLHFLLTGQAPLDTLDADRSLAPLTSDPVSPPKCEAQLNVRAGLDKLIDRCLDSRPASRPSSYADLKKELGALLPSVQPAPSLGQRAAAAGFDLLLLVPIVATALPILIAGQTVSGPAGVAVFALLLLALYWGVVEGAWGAAYGKRRCGLRVVAQSGAAPGLARGLARSGILVLPFILAVLVTSALVHSIDMPAQAITLIAISAAASVIVLPARRRDGFSGLHDILTATQVVRTGVDGRTSRSMAAIELPVLQTVGGERLGPYEIVTTIGETDRGVVQSAWDPQLKRYVWAHVLQVSADPVSPGARSLGRPTRLRWLDGQRCPDKAWDAYEASDGRPLLSVTSRPAWSAVSTWLSDLAAEFEAGQADDTIDSLSLDRIWITRTGHAKWLDFRAPGASAVQPVGDGFDLATAQRFLHDVATHALRAHAGPLPLAASTVLRRLAIGGFATLGEFRTALGQLKTSPDRVTRERRGMALAISIACYWFGAAPLGQFVASSFSIGTIRGYDVGLLSCLVLGVVWAFALRSGAVLHAFDIAVVTGDGQEASRIRSAARAALAWSWVPVQVVAASYGGPMFAILLLKLVGVAYAADHPDRGLHDRLVGTYLVPR